MKNVFSETQKDIDKKVKQIFYEQSEDGRVVINLTVNDDSEFLSTYSENNTPVINEQVAEFIEHSTSAIRPDKRLTLCIKSNCIEETEQTTYKTAITEYYTKKYITNAREYNQNKIIVAFLAAIGIIALVFQVLFEYFVGGVIWSEVIDIFAWVLLWEAFDISVFQNRSLKLKKIRYLSYLDMKIEYVSQK